MKSYHSRPFLSFNSPATLFSQSESIKSYPDAVKNICHLFLEISFSLIFLVKSCLEEPINIKKIIFLVIFLSFDIIFAILWKVLLQSRLFQYVLFFKQISFVVTSYLLLYEKLSKSQFLCPRKQPNFAFDKIFYHYSLFFLRRSEHK